MVDPDRQVMVEVLRPHANAMSTDGVHRAPGSLVGRTWLAA